MTREVAVSIDEIEAKISKREQQQAEAAIRAEGREKPAFVIQPDSTGLLTVRLDGAGTLPDIFKGKRYTNRFQFDQDYKQWSKDAKGEERKTVFKA